MFDRLLKKTTTGKRKKKEKEKKGKICIRGK